ncbi:MAG: cysteine desulfurase [Dehalococcoidia bacterium]|nr:cysteine desulfurase [Dehalococcoidia bacterium]
MSATSEHDSSPVVGPPGGKRIYLDSAASAPLRPEALEAMMPFLTTAYANPSAHHSAGRDASDALEGAREAVAAILNTSPEEVIFTSGGTESINEAIKGVAMAQSEAGVGRHIVTTEIEHHAVLHSAQYLERFGFEVELLPVDEYGRVSPEAAAAAIRSDTVLVSIGYANNEVGTVQPLAEITRAVREAATALGRRVPIHTDAVQVANTHSLDVDALGVDLLSLSGHKFGGPKGTGVLHLRRGVPFLELISGGGQERQRRSGTENVPGVVGMATALRLAQDERESFSARTSALRDRLLDGVRHACPEARINGHPTERLPHSLHACFSNLEGEALVAALDARGIEASAGAACTSATWEPSHVLLAMGVPIDLAVGSLRLGIWPSLTEAQVDYVAQVLPAAVTECRAAAVASRQLPV